MGGAASSQRPVAKSESQIKHLTKRHTYFDICPSLTDISIPHFNISDEGMQVLASAIARAKTLKVLTFYPSLGDFSSHQFSIALVQNSSLQKLEVLGSLNAIASCNVLLGVSRSKSISSLKLSCCKMKEFEGDQKPLLAVLSENHTLTHLDLRDANLHYRCMWDIRDGLAKNKSLQHLDLSCSSFYIDYRFMDAISRHPALTSLSLVSVVGWIIDDILQRDLGTFFEVVTNLKKLEFDSNELGNKICGLMLKPLIHQTSLTSLSFGRTGCDDTNSNVISKILTSNTTLTSLGLSYHKFTPVGIKEILSAVCRNTTLRSLDLSNSQDPLIDTSTAVVDVLRRNATLETLDINETFIGFNYLEIVNALKDNYTITSLSASMFTQKMETQITKYCERNKQFSKTRSSQLAFCYFVLPMMIVGSLVLPSELVHQIRFFLKRLSHKAPSQEELIMFNKSIGTSKK